MDKTKEFTMEEKIELVRKGLMSPEAIGVVPVPGENSSAATTDLEVLPPAQKLPQLGKHVVLQAAEVPMDLRREWAKQECKILPFDAEAWDAKNKDTHLIQCRFQSGTASGAIEGTFSDTVLGLCNILNAVADRLKDFYENGNTKATVEQKPSEVA